MICAIYEYAHTKFFCIQAQGIQNAHLGLPALYDSCWKGKLGQKTRSLKACSRNYENIRKKLKAGICLLCPTDWGQSESSNLGTAGSPIPMICHFQPYVTSREGKFCFCKTGNPHTATHLRGALTCI